MMHFTLDVAGCYLLNVKRFSTGFTSLRKMKKCKLDFTLQVLDSIDYLGTATGNMPFLEDLLLVANGFHLASISLVFHGMERATNMLKLMLNLKPSELDFIGDGLSQLMQL
jgi:hypothetical protein